MLENGSRGELGRSGNSAPDVPATYTMIGLTPRIVGLRSFSKMSAADFAMTVAVGSLFASTISLSAPTFIVFPPPRSS